MAANQKQEPMTMDPQGFLAEALSVTMVVERASKGEVTLAQFLIEYDNFYYRAALDGHEVNAELDQFLSRYPSLVALHRDVQAVIDLVYTPVGGDVVDYESVGRIDANTAVERLQVVADRHAVRKLIEIIRKDVE